MTKAKSFPSSSESNELEVMPNCIPRNSVDKIILDYLDFDSVVTGEQHSYTGKKITFFGHDPLPAIAAHHVLWADPDKAIACAKTYPYILYVVIEARDPVRRRVKGTLLQMAAMMTYVNVKGVGKKDKDYGMVEKLAGLMPEEEVIKQLTETFPPGWEKKTEERMQPYFIAATQFTESILNMEIPEGSTSDSLQNNECKAMIKKFRRAILISSNEVITSGYIFDLQVLCTIVTQLFRGNFDHFGGWDSLKSDLFWVIVYGSLQALVSACDAQLIMCGLIYVVKFNRIPQRSLNFPRDPSYCYFPPSVFPGIRYDFFLNLKGEVKRSATKVLAGYDTTMLDFIDCYQEISQFKTSALQNLMQHSNKRRCVIL